MELTRWNPAREMLNFRHPFRSFFDDFFNLSPMFDQEEGSWNWNPAVDVSENDDAIVVKAELPGVDKRDISVDLNDRILTIKGERSSEKEEKDETFHRRERVHGSFERRFTLPAAVKADKIKADYKDGILRIEVPKSEEAKPKKITVH
jgi:HSP20 family protein